jgi:hypothetical protein
LLCLYQHFLIQRIFHVNYFLLLSTKKRWLFSYWYFLLLFCIDISLFYVWKNSKKNKLWNKGRATYFWRVLEVVKKDKAKKSKAKKSGSTKKAGRIEILLQICLHVLRIWLNIKSRNNSDSEGLSVIEIKAWGRVKNIVMKALKP